METKFFGVTNRNKFLNELIKVLNKKFADKTIVDEDCVKGNGIKNITNLTLEEYNNISEKDNRTIYIVETTIEQHTNYKVYLGTVLLVDSDFPNEIEQLLASI